MDQTQHPPVIPITAHAVTLYLLTYLVDEADRGADGALLAYLPAEELDMLRNITLRDLIRMADQNQTLFGISVYLRQILLSLARVRHRDDADNDRLWFIRRGTPHVLMEELYGTPIREFRELRRIAGMSARPGRPRVLKAAQAERVRDYWRKLGQRKSLPDRYRDLGEAFAEDSIATLYCALHSSRH